jgi:predicted nucleotidyltransferase
MTSGADWAITALPSRQAAAVQALPDAARRVYGPRLVALVLFGSVARGTARPDSDVDLLLVAEGLPAGRRARLAEFAEVEALVARRASPARRHPRGAPPGSEEVTLSPILRTPAEIDAGSWLFLDLTVDARLLVDRGDFMAGRLASIAGKLAAIGARREPYKGSWVWRIPPDPALLRP